MFGFFLFLTTIDIVPHVAYVVLALIALAHSGTFRGDQRTFLLLIGIGVVSMVAYFLGGVLGGATMDIGLPRLILYPLNFVIASRIRREDKEIFIRLVALECAIGIIQFAIGKPSLFGHDAERPIGGENLLYFMAVQGLCGNSSDFAQKIMLAVLLMATLSKVQKVIKYIIILLLGGGMVVTFNRSGLVAVVLFLVFIGATKLRKRSVLPWLFSLGTVSVLILGLFGDFLWIQINKGQNEGYDISGREIIWGQAIVQIWEKPWFGAFGRTVRFEFLDGYYHSHNSFLQLAVENGLVLALLLILIVLSRFDRKNWVFVIPILIYSLTQYGIFWGLSLMDVALWYFMVFAFQSINPGNAVFVTAPIVEGQGFRES